MNNPLYQSMTTSYYAKTHTSDYANNEAQAIAEGKIEIVALFLEVLAW